MTLSRERTRQTGMGTVMPPAETRPVEVSSADWYIATPYAQQVFSLVPAAAGVTAGLLLAQKFASARATHVKASEVIIASALSFAASFGVVFMIRSFQSYDAVDQPGESPENGD